MGEGRWLKIEKKERTAEKPHNVLEKVGL